MSSAVCSAARTLPVPDAVTSSGHPRTDDEGARVRLRRACGFAGLVAGVLVMVQVPFYFLYPGAVPDWDVLTRSLVGLAAGAAYLVFFTGLRTLVQRTGPEQDWPGGLLHAAGLLWVAMVFVPQSMEVGTAISVDRDIDTTTEGPFAPAQYLMQGAIARVLMALFLVALAVVVVRTGAMSRWVGRSALVLAAVNLAFVPAVYFGDDAARFYSAQGWGTTATMGALWSLWTVAVGLGLLRRPHPSEDGTAAGPVPRPGRSR